MTRFLVSIQLEADNSDDAIERIGTWKLSEEEGVMNISQQPEIITVPQEMMPPPPPAPDLPPLEPAPAESNGG
jgi:hypothetical protein